MQFLSREGLQRLDDVPVVPLLEDAFQDAIAKLPKHKASLVVKNENEGLTVAGEEAGLKQVFAEILLNSLQASSKDQRIEVHCRAIDRDDSPWVEVEVLDQGPGFDADQRLRATDPFYSGRSVGLGLGLAVAKRLIELHGGILDLGDEKRGVRVILPRKAVIRPTAASS